MRMIASWMMTAALAAAVPDAHAGRSCETRPMTVDALAGGLAMAQRAAAAMDAGGAAVYVIARAGQDLTRYRLDWSHLGFAYRSAQGWRVVHKLNGCGSANSALYRQGLGQFFLDDPWRQRAALAPLADEAAARLRPVLVDDRAVAALHEPAYSMVAYPWAVRYQQSNQWAIETLAEALDPGVADRRGAQAWLRARGYRPTSLEIDAITRLGARLTRANVAFDDHPDAQRWRGRIDTVTADSVLQWLPRAGLAARVEVIE